MVQKEREGGIREVMSILTIRKAFPDEWVATEVKRVDKADVPIAGRVLLHSPEKHVVYQSMQTYLAQHSAARLFLFFTGDPIPDDVEVALAFR